MHVLRFGNLILVFSSLVLDIFVEDPNLLVNHLSIGGCGQQYWNLSNESPHEDAQITNLIDAFWWVSATVTTVGYGDVVPVTELGRLMGIALMFVGISIIGTFISTLGNVNRL